jgi:hypothetical protein
LKKPPIYDAVVMIDLRGKPTHFVIYRRDASLPRHASGDIRSGDAKHESPADHSPDMLSDIQSRAAVIVSNPGDGCLCNCPVVSIGVPNHIGRYSDDHSVYLCDKAKGFDPAGIAYYQRDRFGDRIYRFFIGGHGGRPYTPVWLNYLAADGWQLELASDAVRQAWGNIPDIRRQGELHALLEVKA